MGLVCRSGAYSTEPASAGEASSNVTRAAREINQRWIFMGLAGGDQIAADLQFTHSRRSHRLACSVRPPLYHAARPESTDQRGNRLAPKCGSIVPANHAGSSTRGAKIKTPKGKRQRSKYQSAKRQDQHGVSAGVGVGHGKTRKNAERAEGGGDEGEGYLTSRWACAITAASLSISFSAG